MKAFFARTIGNTLGAVGSFTGGVLLATGINPGNIGGHLHNAGNEFAHGMNVHATNFAQAKAEKEVEAAVNKELDRHADRSVEITLAALHEQARHEQTMQKLGIVTANAASPMPVI